MRRHTPAQKGEEGGPILPSSVRADDGGASSHPDACRCSSDSMRHRWLQANQSRHRRKQGQASLGGVTDSGRGMCNLNFKSWSKSEWLSVKSSLRQVIAPGAPEGLKGASKGGGSCHDRVPGGEGFKSSPRLHFNT